MGTVFGEVSGLRDEVHSGKPDEWPSFGGLQEPDCEFQAAAPA